MSSRDATASRIRFKDAGFNLTEVLINLVLTPLKTPTATMSFYNQVGPNNSLVFCTATCSLLLRFADTKTC